MKKQPQMTEQTKYFEAVPVEDSAWPLSDVLQKLSEGVEYLLDKKDYDGHDHEELLLCTKLAKKIIEQLRLRPVTGLLTEQQADERAVEVMEWVSKYNYTGHGKWKKIIRLVDEENNNWGTRSEEFTTSELLTLFKSRNQ